MRSFIAFLPFLVASTAALSPIVTPPVAGVQAESAFPSAPSSVFSGLSFNASTTIRAPRSTMTSTKAGMRKEKRYYWGPSIIQDPEPGDTSSQPPIGGDHTTPDASQGLTPPSFPPLPSPSSSSESETHSSSPSSPPDESSSSAAPPEPTAPNSTDSDGETEDPTTSAFFNTKLADNRAKREKARISYTSKLAELSRLSLAAKTATTTSQKPQWTKIRDYRDKILGGERFHKVRRSLHR
ncbi:hypothetical protein JCM3765_003091 [Sporobolomyces pararoseus]